MPGPARPSHEAGFLPTSPADPPKPSGLGLARRVHKPRRATRSGRFGRFEDNDSGGRGASTNAKGQSHQELPHRELHTC